MARPIPPNPDIAARVRALVAETSLAEAGRRLRLADATVARLAGGLPVTEGTALVAAQRLNEQEPA
ncbi:MAG: hypothetical protein M3020_14725 [Myxococcota bacterium]|nr:hypothetical protein [Myxococcota bacterium]